MTACVDENRLVWFLRGELSGAPLLEVEEHLDDCDSCRDLFAVVARSSLLPATVAAAGSGAPRPAPSRLEVELEPGTKVGRFTVMSVLGAGGMGVVYAARDDELDRTVALKLLLADASERSHELLRAEAQALAQLAHPNVIAVYDVGEHGDQLFLAIEHVDGSSLAEWCAQPRPWHETLEVARQAGRGLAAAHAAGIVHRDVKPANIRIGRDGRVRMLDFGLAQRLAVPGAANTIRVLAGTPAYMAPEQLAGAAADARSDQFAFCVTVYEALYGERPFTGLVTAGAALREAPSGTHVPRWVRRVLIRGLAPDPAARYPDMDLLLAALAPRRRVMASLAVVAGVAAIGVTIGVVGSAGSHPGVCTGAADQLATVWNPARKATIQAAFAATGKPFAAQTWTTVADALDRYGQSWVEMHTSACQATRKTGEQSDELLDLRMQCLAEQLQSFDALAAAFAVSDPAIVARAVTAVSSLPSLAVCGDGLALRRRAPLPTDAMARQQIDRLRGEVARARALLAIGHYPDGIALVKALVPEIERIGYGPLDGEALTLLGRLELAGGSYDAADADLRAATRAALSSQADQIAARAATERVQVSYLSEHYAEGLERAKDAAALLHHGGGDDEIEAALDNRRGLCLDALGRFDEASEADSRALEVFQKRYGPDDLRVANLLSSLGGIDSERGHYDHALELQEHALAIARRRLGNAHPDVAGILSNLADTLNQQGRFDEALTRWKDVLEIRTTALRPDHPAIAESLRTIALALENKGKFAEARDYAQRALAIYDKALTPDTRSVAYCEAIIADSLRGEGRYTESLAHAQRSADVLEKAVGPTDDTARALDLVGHVLTDAQRFREAVPVEERAAAMLEKALGPAHPDLADPLTGLGIALLGIDAADRAIDPLTRADRLQEANHSQPNVRVETQFALARALWQSGRDRSQARTLALAADHGFGPEGDHPEQRARIEAWLADHR